MKHFSRKIIVLFTLALTFASLGDNVKAMEPELEACPEGMMEYDSDFLKISFCYPTKEAYGIETIVVENGTTLEIVQNYGSGWTVRETIVEKQIDPSQSREEIVMSYANPNPVETECEVSNVMGEKFSEDFNVYAILSTPELNFEALEECTKTNPLAKYSFLFSKSYPDTLLLMRGTPPMLAGLSDEFYKSIRLTD